MAKKTTLGVVVGTRGFFPTYLAHEGRTDILRILKEEGFDTVCLGPKDATGGAVENLADARACADLFRKHADRIDGILVTLPNFGDEKSVANTLKFAGLDVPVLVHAWPDDAKKMTVANRRDSFCGKMSVCSNLDQYDIPFSLTDLHTVSPDTKSFRADLARFGATCRVVKGLTGARLGAIGARTGPFNTVRYSEKILEGAGISVETIDLSEIFGRANALKASASAVRAKLRAIKGYTDCSAVTADGLDRMARFAVVVERWMKDQGLVGTAIQCWTSIEEFYGIVPCAVMSMMSDALLPSACEVDVTGLVGMLALRHATESPAALVDWNNNYGDDPDKCVLFHCSNLPKSLFAAHKMAVQEIIAQGVGAGNACGSIVGRLKKGPITYCRVATDDVVGEIRAYLGEGKLTADPLETFGGYGVAEIPDLQGLLRFICDTGFEHHVAIAAGQVARGIEDAFETYLGWEVYNHGK
ncbi:MAG TPA: L-fucose/L-arabinose isomerase family protein [Phycisphaerae bacterium]|nr:L-fucose/L-arabinose isomerase family protein [Phycisphaerae bacterium]